MKKLLFTVLCIGAFLGVKAQTSPEPLPIVEFATDAPPKIDTSERVHFFVGGRKTANGLS
ncbi:hypothetical protein ABIB62_002717 [Mucilaginibacter sp. UYP25]|uniref:hypothetical protein n=1 Tax=unclassified Mucilaginibacter TaxID=2617802 RepID=UPI0033961849